VIDLRCHLLPGLDDGTLNLATELTMARVAVDQGGGRSKVFLAQVRLYSRN